MHDLATIQRMNREAALAAITESVTEADEVAEVAERAEAMERHPAGKGKRLTEPAIDPATEPEQDEPGSGERTTKPLKPAEAAHLASASAHELARKVLTGFTKNGEIPFALSGQAALDIIAVAIEADRAQRAADLETLADAASKWATELTDYVIPESANDGLREYMAERDEIQAALGRYLGEKEAGK